MDIEKTIRMQVMRGNGGKIRELLFTDAQVKVVEAVKIKGPIESHALAPYFNCSVQSMSMRLAKLYKQGYLKRAETTAPSGGVEYLYIGVASTIGNKG